MRHLIAVLTAMLLFTAAPAGAGDFEDAWAAYQAGEYQKAFRLWKPLAEQGHADAQSTLGVMYRDGMGCAPAS